MRNIVTLTSLVLVLISCKSEVDADAYGNFETNETIIASETNGKIIGLNIEEGQEVNGKLNSVLIDTTLLYQQKMALLASKKTAQSKQPDIKSQIAIYKSQIFTAETQLRTLYREKRRIENLLKDGAATSKQLDDINSDIDVKKGQIETLRNSLNAQNILLSNQSNTISKEASTIEEQINQINIQINQARIINPMNGVITAKYVELGEVVNFGKPLYKIADLNTMILRAYFSGDQLSSIKLNQEVTVRVDSTDNTYKYYKGKISWISSKSEFTPKIIQTKKERVNFVYAVKIEVKNDGMIKMGMPAEVILEKQETK